jgi:hypothetical protein
MPENIAQWVKELDSEDFTAREEATAKLIAAGRAAIEPVTKAADGESLEVTTRCLDVLAKLHGDKDAETKAAAQKALEGLAKSKNATAARRAKGVLKIEEPAEGTPPRPLGVPVPGKIEIGGIAIAGLGMKISVRTVDGNRVIEATEGATKVKIEEDPKGGIKMEVTETVDGKEKTSKYEAKSADELKKASPEAHKHYEKYSKFGGIGGGIAIMPGLPGGLFPPGVLPPGALPPGFGGGKVRIGRIPQKALDQIEEARKQLDDATEQMKKLAGESRIEPEKVKKLAEQIENAKKQLEEAQKQLGK